MNTTPSAYPIYSWIMMLVPILFIVFSVVVYFLLARWVKLRREASFLTAVGTTLVATAISVANVFQREHSHYGRNDGNMNLVAACSFLLIVLAVPFALKLYRAWTGIAVTEAEKAPGAVGVRAWLSPANGIFAGLIAACATGAYDCQFLGIFALLAGCLLIQPLINTVGADNTSSTAAPTLAAEREKVLSLLEAGRINAEESADLLNALGGSSQPAASKKAVSRSQQLTLIGAGLVLIGFFLPWFSINPGQELNRMTGQMQGMIMDMSGDLRLPEMTNFTSQTPTLRISGGDIAHGLGWLVLLLGLGTAALPHVAGTMDGNTQRTISFIALGIGGIMLFWLISQNLRFLSAGVIVALAGYVIEFVGLLKPHPRPATAPFGTMDQSM